MVINISTHTHSPPLHNPTGAYKPWPQTLSINNKEKAAENKNQPQLLYSINKNLAKPIKKSD